MVLKIIVTVIVYKHMHKLTGDFAPNRGLYHNGRLYDVVYGPFFLALARAGAEDLESLPDDLIDKYLNMYKEPKI